MKTVALKERTFEMLVDLKKETDARTFEEVIVKLFEKSKKVPGNMFGIDRKMKPFTAEEEAEFEGE